MVGINVNMVSGRCIFSLIGIIRKSLRGIILCSLEPGFSSRLLSESASSKCLVA